MSSKNELKAAAEKALRGVRGSWLHRYVASHVGDVMNDAPPEVKTYFEFGCHRSHDGLRALVHAELDERNPPRER